MESDKLKKFLELVDHSEQSAIVHEMNRRKKFRKLLKIIAWFHIKILVNWGSKNWINNFFKNLNNWIVK
jgi:hypothetical protein